MKSQEDEPKVQAEAPPAEEVQENPNKISMQGVTCLLNGVFG